MNPIPSSVTETVFCSLTDLSSQNQRVDHKVTIDTVLSWKGCRRFGALTAYDYPSARLLDEAGVPILLVGDSLGMVVLGHPDTTHVTLDDILHHLRAVVRARPRALVGADMPYGTYKTPSTALATAQCLVNAGAEYVKAEGGTEILPQIQAIIGAGIPFMGHLGMLPQHILEEGGRYRIKGRDDAGHQQLLLDGRALESAGAFACVLELVTPPVAAELTAHCRQMLTLGIGSGSACDAQILVTHDLTGAFPWFTPKFATPLARTGESVRSAALQWLKAVGEQ